MQGGKAGDGALEAILLQTARLILTPLSRLDEAEHQQASGKRDAASRDTRAAALQWRRHGFGPWGIRDRGENSFLGVAELRFAGEGIDGIAPSEVEAGWWVTESRRSEGIATEAMQAAIRDLWARAGVESLTAYIEEGENEPSRRLASSLGFQDPWTGPRSIRRTDDGVRAASHLNTRLGQRSGMTTSIRPIKPRT